MVADLSNAKEIHQRLVSLPQSINVFIFGKCARHRVIITLEGIDQAGDIKGVQLEGYIKTGAV
jgi:hypothetical protein